MEDDNKILQEFKSINIEDQKKIREYLQKYPFLANHSIDIIKYYGNKDLGLFASYITNLITDNNVLHEVFGIALINTFTDVLINILQSGIYPDNIKIDNKYIKSLDYAVETENIELIKILIHYGYYTPRLNNEIFNLALQHDDLGLLQLLLEHNYEISNSEFKQAIEMSAKQIVNYMLSSGRKFDISNVVIPDNMIPVINKYYVIQ